MCIQLAHSWNRINAIFSLESIYCSWAHKGEDTRGSNVKKLFLGHRPPVNWKGDYQKSGFLP